MAKNLSFKIGTSGNRNIANGTRVSPNEGQVIFDYNSILNGENNFYPYADYQINGATAAQKPSYDVKVYLDIDDENRIPLTTKFSDYSSKLWDLSTGIELNCGSNGRPVFFSNGVPCPTQFKIETINRATLGTTPNTFKVSIDATNNNQAIVKLPCNFGICSTAGDTIAKTVTVDISGDTPFVLGNGIKVTILFQNGNTSTLNNVTLNVNNTGAKKIKIGNSSNLSTNFIKSGQICHFTYYNDYWYLDSSPEATASQNGLLSINSQQIKGQKDFLDKILLRNGFEFRGPSAVPLASLSGSNIGDSEKGLVTLAIGSIASAADQGKGCIKLYNNEIKTTTLTTYSNDINTSNQTIYFRNYGSADNYFVTTNTPTRLGGSEDTNGDKPVYISDKGVATECNGIVVTGSAQTFDGNKTFTGNIKIATKNPESVDNTAQYNCFYISDENYDNDGYKLYFDARGFQTIKNNETSDLYLNADGGLIQLGTGIEIDDNVIQANNYQNSSPSNENFYIKTLELNKKGGSTSIGKNTPIEITENGIVTISNTTESSAYTNGALIVGGGIGVAKTSYMASIYPGASRTTTYTLGSASNIWSGVYSQYNYLFGSSGNNYTQIKTEDTPSSSVTVTVPNIDGNVTISKTSDFENDGDSVKYYKIPFYTTDYKEIGVNDGFRLWQYKGSTDKADEGISTLTLGNDKPSETENNKYGAVDIYSIDSSYQSLRSAVSETRGVTYLRNYGTSGFLVATAELNTAVGGEATNGDTPVFISETGLATACTGIVVNELAQTFKGSKTFSSQMVLTTKGSIDSYNTGGTLRIGPSTITSSNSLLFNRDTIQARDKSGNGNDLYLNPNGGDILFGDYSYFSPEASSDGGNYLFIDGEIETQGDIICGGSISSGGIYPMSHNQWNIGSDTVRWDNIYVSNYVSTGALQLGNTGGSPSTNKTTTIGYGTSDPSSVVSSPEIGRVYFKIIS